MTQYWRCFGLAGMAKGGPRRHLTGARWTACTRLVGYRIPKVAPRKWLSVKPVPSARRNSSSKCSPAGNEARPCAAQAVFAAHRAVQGWYRTLLSDRLSALAGSGPNLIETHQPSRRTPHHTATTSNSGVPRQWSCQLAPGRTLRTTEGSKATKHRPPGWRTDG